MGTVYIEHSAAKLEEVSDQLQLKEKSDGQHHRASELTDYTCRVLGIDINSAERSTLLRNFQKAWKNEPGPFSGPKFKKFLTALGFSERDFDWFAKGNMSEFRNKLNGYEFPSPSYGTSGVSLEYKTNPPEHKLSVDLATIDVFSTTQHGCEYPMLNFYFALIRIPEQKLSYGFRSVLVSFEFEDNSELTMIDRTGERGNKYQFEGRAQLVARRTKYDPMFEIFSNDIQRPLELDEVGPVMGRIVGLHEGATFSVKVRAELKSDLIKAEGEVNDIELEQLQKLVMRKQLKRAAGVQDLQLTSDGQFIELVSQEVRLKRC